MTASTAAVDDVIAALLTTFQTAVGTSVPVYDGPAPDDALAQTQFLLVGDDGGEEAGEAATLTQTRVERTLTYVTTESGDVTCAVVCQSGYDDFPGLRTSSRTLMQAVEARLALDRTLGGVCERALITDVTLWQERTQGGSFVRRVFTVHYDARQ